MEYVGTTNMSASNTAYTLDVSGRSDYRTLTADNFIPVFDHIFGSGGQTGAGDSTTTLSKAYNQQTGIFSVTRTTMKGTVAQLYLKWYVFKGTIKE